MVISFTALSNITLLGGGGEGVGFGGVLLQLGSIHEEHVKEKYREVREDIRCFKIPVLVFHG